MFTLSLVLYWKCVHNYVLPSRGNVHINIYDTLMFFRSSLTSLRSLIGRPMFRSCWMWSNLTEDLFIPGHLQWNAVLQTISGSSCNSVGVPSHLTGRQQLLSCRCYALPPSKRVDAVAPFWNILHQITHWTHYTSLIWLEPIRGKKEARLQVLRSA